MPAISEERKRKPSPNPLGKHVTRFPGILKHARTLGVNPSHLYRVLMGQRPSSSLANRYRELLAKEESAQ